MMKLEYLCNTGMKFCNAFLVSFKSLSLSLSPRSVLLKEFSRNWYSFVNYLLGVHDKCILIVDSKDLQTLRVIFWSKFNSPESYVKNVLFVFCLTF